MSAVTTGLDVLAKRGHPALRGKRTGLIVHQASVTRSLHHGVNALRERRDLTITALFAPEHGLGGELQDQVPVQGAPDRSGLPVYSLYGEERKPTPAMLEEVDALVFDLQDIGVRYYTFIWTMLLAMEACAEFGKTMVVLDRPNPLGGLRREGNLPDPGFASFVGLHPLPVLHAMTAGELAQYLKAARSLPLELTVIPMAGWKRRMRFSDTGLPWVLPSPNMPTLDTATVYGGMCLLEATNLSEGRGTTRPFELVGAPFVDGPRLAEALAGYRLPGVRFRPCVFQPTQNKWAGKLCGGVQIHVTDAGQYRSYLTGLALLQAVRKTWPQEFRWNDPPYEFETEKPPIDILCGTDSLRQAVDEGRDLSTLEKSWAGPLAKFARDVRPFLLY